MPVASRTAWQDGWKSLSGSPGSPARCRVDQLLLDPLLQVALDEERCHLRQPVFHPTFRSRPGEAIRPLTGSIRIESDAPKARAHFTSVLTPRFFTRPDSSFAT